MRHKDENKHKAIVNAAIQLITKEGFAETSMSKIAKAANVSPATIYIYFENKEDLLNQVYLIVKKDFGNAVCKGIDENISIKESFQLIWENARNYFLANPTTFVLHEQFVHSPLLSKANKEQGECFFMPITQLYERGKAEGTLPDIPIFVLSAIMYSPLISLIKEHHQGNFVLTQEVTISTFEMCWKAIQ